MSIDLIPLVRLPFQDLFCLLFLHLPKHPVDGRQSGTVQYIIVMQFFLYTMWMYPPSARMCLEVIIRLEVHIATPAVIGTETRKKVNYTYTDIYRTNHTHSSGPGMIAGGIAVHTWSTPLCPHVSHICASLEHIKICHINIFPAAIYIYCISLTFHLHQRRTKRWRHHWSKETKQHR